MTDTTHLSPGSLFAGKYRIERLLGAGGMGTVLKARDIRSDTPIALKVLHPRIAGKGSIVTRFHREARVTSWLKSEHVTRVLDSGIVVDANSMATHYLAMELLEGSDLRHLVLGEGALSVEDAAEYVSQACVALSEAHALGLVHRDLKPANMIRCTREDGSVILKLLDFGIAKFTSANVAGDDVEITSSSTMMGSRRYTAPEQMLDAKSVDARADIWSLGVILYFLLTEAPPFDEESELDTSLAVLTQPHKPIRELRPDVPEELGAVVDKCLQKHRENRFSNVAELARALEPFAASTSKSEPRIQLSVTTLALPTVRLDEGAPENELDDDDIEVILDDDDIVQACA